MAAVKKITTANLDVTSFLPFYTLLKMQNS